MIQMINKTLLPHLKNNDDPKLRDLSKESLLICLMVLEQQKKQTKEMT